MKNIIELDFQLLATSCPPKEISRRTGIVPDVELLRGERNSALDLPRQNLWTIRSRVVSDVVSDHWNDLESILSGSKDVIKDIAGTGSARLTLVVNGGDRLPSIIIPTSMSAFAAYVGAIIDIDHIQY